MDNYPSIPEPEALQKVAQAALATDGASAEAVAKLMKATGIGKQALLKIASGVRVRPGTAALFALRTGMISELGPELAGEPCDE
jgi:hypothetical protein